MRLVDYDYDDDGEQNKQMDDWYKKIMSIKKVYIQIGDLQLRSDK